MMDDLKKKRAEEVADGMWYANMSSGHGPVGWGPIYYVCNYEMAQLEANGQINTVKVQGIIRDGMADVTTYVKVDAQEGIPFNVRSCSADNCNHDEVSQ
jgi:hypothetical protein